MLPVELHSGVKGVAIGGLDWRAINNQKSVARWAREYRSHKDFNYFVCAAASNGHGAMGLHVSLLDERSKLPKGAYSAALAFAAKVGGQHAAAALILQAGMKGDDVYVVVLEDGLPINDLVTDIGRATALIGEGRFVYSDSPAFGEGEASFEWLAASADKARFRSVPVNVLAILLAITVCVAAIGAYVAVDYKKRAAADAEALAQAKELDPAPRYLAALASQKLMVAPRREDLLEVARSLFSQPTIARGWLLEEIDCQVSTATCTSKWLRRGGTYVDLRQAMVGSELVPSGASGGAAPDLERAETRYPVAIKRGPLSDGAATPLPKSQQLAMDLGSVFQVWKTAKLRLEQGQPLLWPAAIGVPPSFEHPEAVLRSPVAINDIPGPFLGEIIAHSPWFIAWESVGVTVSEGGEPANRVKFSLKGSIYAAQQ